MSEPRTGPIDRLWLVLSSMRTTAVLVILLAGAVFLWMIFAVWPDWLVSAIGRKKTFVNTLLNGVTLGGLDWKALRDEGRR